MYIYVPGNRFSLRPLTHPRDLLVTARSLPSSLCGVTQQSSDGVTLLSFISLPSSDRESMET